MSNFVGVIGPSNSIIWDYARAILGPWSYVWTGFSPGNLQKTSKTFDTNISALSPNYTLFGFYPHREKSIERSVLLKVKWRETLHFVEEHVKEGNPDSSEKDLAVIVKNLLPSVIRLVAQHFHKSLVSRSLERIDGRDKTVLSNALIASDPENLVVTCEWR